MFWRDAVALACAVLLAASPHGAAEPLLHQHRTAEENRGWEAVGRLNLGARGFCTASLVTSDIVLTAAHCMFRKDGSRLDPAQIEFQAGLRFGEAEARRGVRRIVLHPDYDFHAAARLPRVGTDLALVELDRPVREANVLPFRTRLGIPSGAEVQVLSYAKDRAEAPSREEACRVLTRSVDVLVLSCRVNFGASGAPVFAQVAGERRIVSVISAKAMWEGREVALAAAMEGEMDVLLAELARTPALAPAGRQIASADPAAPVLTE